MKLHEILAVKGATVFSICSKATLAEMAQSLVDHNCGSLVVIDDGKMCGIITERDFLKAFINARRPLGELSVRDYMTREVATGSPEDDVNDVLGVMTDRRIRHLPILDGEQLVGMVSIGDLVKAQHDQLTVENHFMKNYIMG
ncbi:MAG: CBS domain-containing protein [Planctomycetales bacterium]|nr:CBS domain-containing protein [Planctomycetales bacterium]